MFSVLKRSTSLYTTRGVAPLRTPAQVLNRRLLSTDQYHELADETLESITEGYEKVIDVKPEVDVDLSHGVLTLVMPPAGTYVINKQPPNLQIWLSSPLSGPKRYEWDENTNKWVYFRDNTSLGELLKQEAKDVLGVELDLDVN